MATTITATEARASLPELLTRVEEGDEVTITRHGRAVAVLVSPHALRSRRADGALAAADRLHALVDEAAAAVAACRRPDRTAGRGTGRSDPSRARDPMTDAFDADVLIFAAVPGHPLGTRIAALFGAAAPGVHAGIGSVLLLPEVLATPLRDGATEEVRRLAGFLGRLDLRPPGPGDRRTRNGPRRALSATRR